MIVGEQIIADSNGNREVFKMIQTEGANQMPDMDVVMKSLKRCSDMTICPDDCSYRKYAPDCIEKLHRDAIALLKEQNELLKQQAELLKEQEAVEPIAIKQEMFDEFYGAVACCPKCGCMWLMNRENNMHYCPECGQAVKWND